MHITPHQTHTHAYTRRTQNTPQAININILLTI